MVWLNKPLGRVAVVVQRISHIRIKTTKAQTKSILNVYCEVLSISQKDRSI